MSQRIGDLLGLPRDRIPLLERNHAQSVAVLGLPECCEETCFIMRNAAGYAECDRRNGICRVRITEEAIAAKEHP